MSESLAVVEQAASLRSDGLHPLVAALDVLGAHKIMGTPESNRQFWQTTDFASAERLFLWANALVRGIPGRQGGYATKSNAIGSAAHIGYIPPEPKEGRELLQQAWDAARSIDDDARAATLLGLGVNMVHGLDYANGRMARLVYFLRRYGYDGKDDTKQYLSGLLMRGSREELDMDPDAAKLALKFVCLKDAETTIANNEEGVRIVGVEKPVAIAGVMGLKIDESLGLLFGAFSESFFNVPLLLNIIFRSGFGKLGLKSFMTEEDKINVDLVWGSIVAVGYVNPEDILTNQAELKKAYIGSVIDCIARDDDSVYPAGYADKIVATYQPKNLPQRYRALSSLALAQAS